MVPISDSSDMDMDFTKIFVDTQNMSWIDNIHTYEHRYVYRDSAYESRISLFGSKDSLISSSIR